MDGKANLGENLITNTPLQPASGHMDWSRSRKQYTILGTQHLKPIHIHPPAIAQSATSPTQHRTCYSLMCYHMATLIIHMFTLHNNTSPPIAAGVAVPAPPVGTICLSPT